MPLNKDELKTVNIVTLGCSKNVVDSEHLAAQLENNNLQVTYDANTFTDVVIINTCGFIHDAKQESIDSILQFTEAKKKGKIKKIIVMGCLSERYKEDLKVSIPEVDAFYGVKDLNEILKYIQTDLKKELIGERKLSTLNHYAYLKIAEGCDRSCSFCAIPIIRGKHHSKSIEELVDESKKLTQKGVKELLLISQDLTYYGVDNYKSKQLPKLLNELVKVDGLEWIRLHYLYPSNFPLEVLDLMKDFPQVCKYIDIPFQHINNSILQSMRRGHNSDDIYRLIDTFRNKLPEVAIRTTLITGYPGESDADFEELKRFVEKSRFDRMGVFSYSHEEDTPAYLLKDDVPNDVKQARVEELMQLQENISYEINYDKIGKEYKVIVDRKEGEFYVARTEFDSPEVDNEVLIKVNGKQLTIGEFYKAKITSVEPFDLYAEII